MAAIVVYSAPVPKARPRLGRGRIFTPRTTERAEYEIRRTWIAEHGDCPASGPLSMQITVYLIQPASIAKRDRLSALPTKRPDADNYAKTALDALNAVAYVDDSQIVDLTVSKRYAVDSSPRWEIRIVAVLGGHHGPQ